jgi:hypothetical protein
MFGRAVDTNAWIASFCFSCQRANLAVATLFGELHVACVKPGGTIKAIPFFNEMLAYLWLQKSEYSA